MQLTVLANLLSAAGIPDFKIDPATDPCVAQSFHALWGAPGVVGALNIAPAADVETAAEVLTTTSSRAYAWRALWLLVRWPATTIVVPITGIMTIASGHYEDVLVNMIIAAGMCAAPGILIWTLGMSFDLVVLVLKMIVKVISSWVRWVYGVYSLGKPVGGSQGVKKLKRPHVALSRSAGSSSPLPTAL